MFDGTYEGLNRHNLIEPFYINVALNLNTCYTPLYKHEPFKYNAAILVSKMIFATSPALVDDVFEFVNYTESFSYSKVLNKFKPLIRVKTFI